MPKKALALGGSLTCSPAGQKDRRGLDLSSKSRLALQNAPRINQITGVIGSNRPRTTRLESSRSAFQPALGKPCLFQFAWVCLLQGGQTHGKLQNDTSIALFSQSDESQRGGDSRVAETPSPLQSQTTRFKALERVEQDPGPLGGDVQTHAEIQVFPSLVPLRFKELLAGQTFVREVTP